MHEPTLTTWQGKYADICQDPSPSPVIWIELLQMPPAGVRNLARKPLRSGAVIPAAIAVDGQRTAKFG